MADLAIEYRHLMLKLTQIDDHLTLFKKLKFKNLGTAAVEEACKALHDYQNASTETTECLRGRILLDKISDIEKVKSEVLCAIDNIVSKIEATTIDVVDNEGRVIEEAPYSANKWNKFKKLTRKKTNELWSALKTKRMEKIKHLEKKYPKISNRKRKASKNKSNLGVDNSTSTSESVDSTKSTKIESLIDIEVIKKDILEKYSTNTSDTTIILKNNPVNLLFTYRH